MKKHIALIFGGQSSEHEVSINSAKNIFKALDKSLFTVSLLGISKEGSWYLFSDSEIENLKSIRDTDINQEKHAALVAKKSKPYILQLHNSQYTPVDCAFPIVHGTNGEDGVLQGYLKMVGVPFVGCGVMGSAINMDKEVMKIVMTSAGIPNSKYLVLKSTKPTQYDDIVKKLGSPFFIKPANAGSSVGVHKIKTAADFSTQLKDSFKYDHKVIAEEFIDGREIECSVMGLNHKANAATPGELVVKHEFYSYEAKYLDDHGAEIVIPAKIDSTKTEELRTLAAKAYEALYCDGLARVDFFMKKNGDLVVNELNTLPGFTKISMYPMMWKAHGVEYSSLITMLIQCAFERAEFDRNLDLNFMK